MLDIVVIFAILSLIFFFVIAGGLPASEAAPASIIFLACLAFMSYFW